MNISTTFDPVREPRTPRNPLEAVRSALATLERCWAAASIRAPIVRTVVINEDGVFLGSTKLAPHARGHEARIHALASYFYSRAAPLSLAKTLEAATDDYLTGDKVKSAMSLALTAPTPVVDEENWRKLHIAAGLLNAGVNSPPRLACACRHRLP